MNGSGEIRPCHVADRAESLEVGCREPNRGSRVGSRVSGTESANSAFGDVYKYTGREFDSETGLQYNRARFYSCAIGRWISQDPLGFQPGDTNLYRYAHNSPINDTDPSGALARSTQVPEFPDPLPQFPFWPRSGSQDNEILELPCMAGWLTVMDTQIQLSEARQALYSHIQELSKTTDKKQRQFLLQVIAGDVKYIKELLQELDDAWREIFDCMHDGEVVA